MPADTYAARLSALMAAADLSDADLAALAGTTRQHIWRLRTGQREPYYATFIAVADALGVSLDDFRGAKRKEKKSATTT